MSKFEDGSYGSLTGIALIGKVLAGRCKMKYLRAMVGSGTIPEGETPKTMTGCAGYVMDAKIASVTNPVDGECQVTVQIRSDDVRTGFYATNIVLTAEDPDDGEVAYTYLSLENEPEWIRPASSIVGKLATFDLIAAVGDVDCVTAIIDPEAIATVGHVQELIKEHNDDPNAHGGAIGGGGGIHTFGAVIRADSWQKYDTPENGYAYYYDITDASVTASGKPMVTIAENALELAKQCGMCQTAASFEGYIRVKCVEKPSEDITVECDLYSQGGGSGGYTLPVATTDILGGVKVGEGINVQTDGTASVDVADLSDPTVDALSERVSETEDNAEEMLDEIFGSPEN